MNVLLINPPRYKGLLVIREERCEIVEGSSILVPYSLLQIGALIEKKIKKIQLIDANALNLDYDELKKRMVEIEYDVLIFKFTPESFDNDMEVAKISKRLRPKAKTVGLCYSLGPIAKEVMADAKEMDIYVRHEYEFVTPNVIENIENLSKVNGIAYRSKNQIIVNKDETGIYDYDSLPIPAYHLLPSLDRYFISVNHGKPFTIVYTSKGCPYNCMYCNVSQSRLKFKSVDRVMKEIKFLKKKYNIRTISFFDETFTLDKKRVLEICKRIKKYNIKWYCNTRANLVTLPLLKAMREAGCRAVCYGIESGSQKILDSVSKRNTVEQNANAIKWADMAGLKTHCSFIIGLPGETKETIKETFQFIKKNLPGSVEFNIATPFPGTRYYDYAIKNGLIKKDLNWRKLSQDTARFECGDLSNEYLEKIKKRAYKTVYFNPRWFFKNLWYTIKNPDDFVLASRYFKKILKDIFIHKFKIIEDEK